MARTVDKLKNPSDLKTLMKKLIITADDFGLTEGVSRAIIEGHKRGIVTSTSLLANGEAFDAAVRMARDAPGLSIGVHLNLSEGRPVSPSENVRSLTTRDGAFLGAPGRLARRIMTGRVSRRELETELRAQVQKVQAAGIKPTHLDGHKHVQALPPVFKAMIQVALDTGIRSVRVSAEESGGAVRLFRGQVSHRRKLLKQWAAARALSLLSLRQRKMAIRAGLACPEHFFGVIQTGLLDAPALAEIMSRLPEGVSELMCHPGYVDEALRKTPTRLLQEREMELRSLTAADIKRLLSSIGVQLIGHRDLNGA
jgi:hopanoid biosynthesis associated protein HpnK